MTRRQACWVTLSLVLAGCPEERPGAEKRIPSQALPPAVTVEPQAGADGGAVAAPSAQPGAATPAPAPAPAGTPTRRP